MAKSRRVDDAVAAAVATAPIQMPSENSWNLILTQARNCPLLNMDHGKAVEKAFDEVVVFLNQIKSQSVPAPAAAAAPAAPSTSPQASAKT